MKWDKRITIFEHSDPFTESSNGIENIVFSLIKYRRDYNWVFVGATTNRNYRLGRSYFQQSQPNLIFIPITYIRKNGRRMIPNSLKLLIGIIRFRKILNPSLIHTHRIELGLFLGILWPNSRIVQFIHNEASSLRRTSSSSFWKYFKNIQKIVEKFSITRSLRVVVFNLSEHNRLRASYGNNAKIIRAQTWYDQEIFYPASVAIPSRKEEQPLRLIWVGRFEKEKNPCFVLDIADVLKRIQVSFEIVMVGEGSLSKVFKKKLMNMKIEKYFRMVGRIDSRELANFYRNSNLFISTSYYEGSPTTLVEALASGLPCVCSSNSDPDTQIINGFNGFRVIDNNAENFASAILNVSNFPRRNMTESVLNRRKSLILPELFNNSILV